MFIVLCSFHSVQALNAEEEAFDEDEDERGRELLLLLLPIVRIIALVILGLVCATLRLSEIFKYIARIALSKLARI